MKIKIFCLLVAYLLCFNLSYADNNNSNVQVQADEKASPEYIEQHLSELNIIKSGKRSSYTPQIRQAINCYKVKNYTSCLQILKNVEKKEPYNSVVTYYLGLANLKLGKKDEALNYFKSTSLLDPYSVVGKYAKQTMESINNPEAINDIKVEIDEVSSFIKSGKKVAPEVINQMSKQRLEAEKEEINSDVKKQTEELKRQQIRERQRQNINNNMSSNEPTNDEIAQAVKTFQKLGLNPFNSQGAQNYSQMTPQQRQQMQSINNDMMQLSMLMGQANNNSNNNMMNMLPFMMMQNNSPNSNFKMTPEMIQTMMMSQMMPNLDFGMNSNNSRN
ncbi:MAG: hypothetical protein MRZ90_07995 [Candidatus Gastranaerophilales bacterium]|nr:hypothetical protein [Candidatus Gastranaerophilales bacterium]